MQVFQVVPPVVRNVGNGFEMDNDFIESLKVYLNHFDSFAVACPILTADLKGSGLEQCTPIRDLPWGEDRLKFIPLPTTYAPIEFLKSFPGVRKKLRQEIEVADYLIFSPYSLIGDWPTVAIREAVKLGRPYTVESDIVQTDSIRRREITSVFWKKFLKQQVIFPLFDRSFQYCLKNSSLGIFQGQDVYDAYAPYCNNAHKLNHHVPVNAGDHIDVSELQEKLESIARGDRIKICYAGRASDLKGPLDWINVLHHLSTLDVQFDAIWLGDGPRLEEMRNKIEELEISGVNLPGFSSDRSAIFRAIKEAHVFLFCHNTLESARVLGEALACGTPLVGFESAYPVDLTSQFGGGIYCEMGNIGALARKVEELDKDRDSLATLVKQAARSGREFDRHAALTRRAELVKQQSWRQAAS